MAWKVLSRFRGFANWNVFIWFYRLGGQVLCRNRLKMIDPCCWPMTRGWFLFALYLSLLFHAVQWRDNQLIRAALYQIAFNTIQCYSEGEGRVLSQPRGKRTKVISRLSQQGRTMRGFNFNSLDAVLLLVGQAHRHHHHIASIVSLIPCLFRWFTKTAFKLPNNGRQQRRRARISQEGRGVIGMECSFPVQKPFQSSSLLSSPLLTTQSQPFHAIITAMRCAKIMEWQKHILNRCCGPVLN